MQIIKTVPMLDTSRGDRRPRIEFAVGDLTQIPDDHAVDVLILSAFPGDYTPTKTSLIGALHSKGINVSALAGKPEVDFREEFSSWISRDVTKEFPAAHFSRILCFEPRTREAAPAFVGDIFRALAPFVFGSPGIRSIAMPVLAAGDQGNSVEIMLVALLEASWHWMAAGMPLDVIKIVLRPQDVTASVKECLRTIDSHLNVDSIEFRAVFSEDRNYDVFVSYSRVDSEIAHYLTTSLEQRGVRVFLDRNQIAPGAAWQQEIFDALECCKTTVAMYSPDFVTSKVCQEEFNISWARQRELEREIIFPLYIRDAKLPTYMRMLNYVDCRASDQTKVDGAVQLILNRLS